MQMYPYNHLVIDTILEKAVECRHELWMQWVFGRCGRQNNRVINKKVMWRWG